MAWSKNLIFSSVPEEINTEVLIQINLQNLHLTYIHFILWWRKDFLRYNQGLNTKFVRNRIRPWTVWETNIIPTPNVLIWIPSKEPLTSKTVLLNETHFVRISGWILGDLYKLTSKERPKVGHGRLYDTTYTTLVSKKSSVVFWP